jgi:hypothetical protein
MSVRRNLFFVLDCNVSVGGNVYVPPTACPRPAYTSARAADYVECTGSVRTKKLRAGLSGSGAITNSTILELS